MSEKKFREPKITINKVYTRTGDEGKTGLVGGRRVAKDHIRIEAYGDVDELNSAIGGCREAIKDYIDGHPQLLAVSDILLRIQHELFNTGTVLATIPEEITSDLHGITELDIQRLENEMDKFNTDLPVLHSFVLAGGSKANIWFHMARNICRRAERRSISLSSECELDPLVIKYLNRLSDALFVYSRWVNHAIGCDEVTWNPNISKL
jgi:cob(I)alamin adenosyltransferase